MSAWRRRMIRRLSEAQNHRCCYCGVDMVADHLHQHGATIEHVVTRAAGGKTTWLNLVAACRTCNTKRGCKPLAHFIRQAPTAEAA